MVNAEQVIAISCTTVCAVLIVWCARREATSARAKPLQYLLLAVGIQGVSSATAIASTENSDGNDVLREHLQAIAVALVAVAACMLLYRPS